MLFKLMLLHPLCCTLFHIFLSKPAAYITHNATRLLTVQSEFWVCYVIAANVASCLKRSGELAYFSLHTNRFSFFFFIFSRLQPHPTLTQVTSLEVINHTSLSFL